MNYVGDMVADRGWGQKTVGVEMDAYYFSARGYAELQKHLPDARFANADLLVNWIRLIKSDDEIALMREAGQIANRVMTTAIDRLEPGVRECDAVAAVYQAQMSGTAEFGGDYPADRRENLGAPSDLDRCTLRKRADGQPGAGCLPASLPLSHRPHGLSGPEAAGQTGGTGRAHGRSPRAGATRPGSRPARPRARPCSRRAW